MCVCVCVPYVKYFNIDSGNIANKYRNMSNFSFSICEHCACYFYVSCLSIHVKGDTVHQPVEVETVVVVLVEIESIK